MDNFVKRLASLCSVKSIVTLVLTGVFAYLSIAKMIKNGLVNGKGGSGESLIIDMSEDMIRTLVILDRAGNFDR